MAVPYTFGSATSSIPLSQLDSNFATGITLGNTTVYLGNTTTSFGNVSLTNVTISSVSTAITPAQGGTGLITIPANNVILGNGTSNVAVVAPGTSGNVLTSNGTTWSSATISAASVSAAGSTTQVQYNNAGAFAGSANLTFNGTTLTAAGLAGPFNGTVGATTANTGAFTTLSASSTVSGTGFSTYLASPPAIGGTAAAAGTFTTLTTSSTITDNGGTANGVTYLNGSKVVTSGSALTFDGTDLATTGSFSTGNAQNISLNVTSSGQTNRLQWKYQGTAYAWIERINSNGDMAFTVQSAEGMRLTSTGLGIGTSSPNTKLQVNGNVVIGNGTIGAPASGYQLRITADNTDFYDFGRNSSTGYFISNSSQASPYRGFIWAYGGTAQATLDASGNLGLGVTPSAWQSGFKVVQISAGSSIGSNGTQDRTDLSSNWYYNGGDKYIGTGKASIFLQNAGAFSWYQTNTSGTAGNPITFTQAMTLDASGNLGVGTTSPINNGGYGGFSLNGTSGALFSMMTNGTESSRIASVGNETSIQSKATTGYITFVQGVSGGTERARIDSSGNLLVGTTSSSAIANKNIDVNGTGDAAFVVRVGGTTTSYLYSTAGQTILGTVGALPITFNPNGTERVRITSDGELLVGINSVSGITTKSLFYSSTAGTTTINSWNADTSGTRFHMQFRDGAGASVQGSITTNGSSTLYNTTSDQRLKENIVNAPDFGSVIDSIQVRSFDWKADGTHQRAGFVAQELVTVAPEAVNQPTDTDEMMAVDYSKLVPMLVKEIQSLRQRLSAANL